MHPLAERFSERAAAAGLIVSDALRTSLLAYYDRLVRWNAKINLTALRDPDDAIDRLLLEPVAAARHLTEGRDLMDLGSGGGSPAIPLALALGSRRLVMVESKARKAAFLREAAVAAEIAATVETDRFEALAEAGRYSGAFPVVSMRAVRMDSVSLDAAATFLAAEGLLALFVSSGVVPDMAPGLQLSSRRALLPGSELLLVRLDVPRGTS